MSESITYLIKNRTTRFWCPGCDDVHMVDNDTWQVLVPNAKLTIIPSVLVYERNKLINEDLEGEGLLSPSNITQAPRCHSFVTNGYIQFLADSTHHLANQIVDLPPLPTWLIE